MARNRHLSGAGIPVQWTGFNRHLTKISANGSNALPESHTGQKKVSRSLVFDAIATEKGFRDLRASSS